MKFLEKLYFHKYQINLKPVDYINLPPNKGSTFRGVFGYALRKFICPVKRTDCDECILKYRCVYSTTFETPIPDEHPFSKKYKNIPPPYLIEPPATNKLHFIEKDMISFNLITIGKADEYLPYFVMVLKEMEKKGIGRGRGKFEIMSIESVSNDGSKIVIYDNSNQFLKISSNKIDINCFNSEKLNVEEISLIIETPLRLKVGNRLTSEIPFNILALRLLERAFLLAHFHCDAKIEDYKNYLDGAEGIEVTNADLHWSDWERYSSRQDTKMKLGGLVGKITYSGDLLKFLTLLRFGENLHVGKATTFGNGKYRINNEEV